MYVSAIHLNAKASSALSSANVASSAKWKKQHDKPKGKNKNVKQANCNKENEELAQQHFSTVKDIAHTDFSHYNFNYENTANADEVTVKENKRTTMTTFCTCCFKEIPANTEIVNSSQLEQIAQDMSVERDCLWHDKNNTQVMKEVYPQQIVNDNYKETNTSAIEAGECSPEEENRNNNNRNVEWTSKYDPSHKQESYDKTYNKLKKPSRSAKMKSDAAVALKEHLQEQAMERRAEAIRRYVKAKKERLAQYMANTEHIEME